MHPRKKFAAANVVLMSGMAVFLACAMAILARRSDLSFLWLLGPLFLMFMAAAVFFALMLRHSDRWYEAREETIRARMAEEWKRHPVLALVLIVLASASAFMAVWIANWISALFH